MANFSMFEELPYDSVKDFEPITGVAIGGVVLAVTRSTPAKNVQVAKLNGLIVPIMKSGEADKFFGQNAWKSIPCASGELAVFQRVETDRRACLVKAAGIEPECGAER